MKKFFSAVIVLIAFHSNGLISQEVEETVVVTSALVDTSEITNPLYVIDGENVTDDATTSLGDAIDSYLGVSIADYGAAVGQPIIRGMSGPRVKVLKNGMVNRDVSGLGVDHLNDVDLNDIDQIEIVKGPSSLLYANGTIGGIINVVDDVISPVDFDAREIKVGYEDQSVNDGDSKTINYRNNIGGFNFNFGYKDTDFENYDIPNGAIEEEHDEDEPHDPDEEEHHEECDGCIANSDFAVEATKFGLSKTGDWGYLGFSLDNLESVYGIPFHGEEHEEPEGEGEPEPHGEERIFSTTDSETFNIKGSYNVNGNLVNKIDFNYRDSDYSLTEDHEEEHDEDEPHDPDEEEHEPTVFLNDAIEYGASFDISSGDLSQNIVVNFVDEDNAIFGEESFMNPANNEEFTIGYYLSREINLLDNDFDVDFGLRVDQIERSGSVTDEDHGDIDQYSIDDTTNSFAISIGNDLTDNLSVNMGFASVERLPSVIELFMNGPHMATGRYEIGDPTLSSETSDNFDITLNYEKDGLYAYASFFVNDVNNYIALIDQEEHEGEEEEEEEEHHSECHHEEEEEGADPHPHPELICSMYMQEDAEFDGYEFEFGKAFEMNSGVLDVSFGRDVINAEFSDGHYVPRINPSRNVYSMSYSTNDLIFKLQLKDVDKQKEIGEGETETDAYKMLDFRVTKTFSLRDNSELKLSLFGKNLLDEVARNHASFVKDPVPLPGKNMGVKFSLTF